MAVNIYKSKSREILFLLIVFMMFTMLLAYSPVLAFFVPLMFLALNYSFPISIRMILASISVFGAGFTVASRLIRTNLKEDDFSYIYYPLYKQIAIGQSIFDTNFSGGIEFVLPLLFKTFHFLTGTLNPVYIMAFVTILCIGSTYVWLEMFAMKNIENRLKGLCVAATVSMVAFTVTGQNMRQAISCIFLLFAISYYLDKRKIVSGVFFLIAFFSHTTALIVFPLFIVLLKGSTKIKVISLISCAIVSVFFNVLIGYAISTGALGAATYKLIYYTSDIQVSAGIGYLKFLILIVGFSFFFFSKEHNEYKSLAIFGALIYAILMPIPVLPYRFLLLLVTYLLGYLLFLSLHRIPIACRILIILFCSYRIIKYGPFFNVDPNDYMVLWASYPWAGQDFFYYFK